MRRILTAALLALLAAGAAAQKAPRLRTVEATYTYQVPDNVGLDEAKRTALARARLQALADAFGTRIEQTTTTRVSAGGGSDGVSMLTTGASQTGGEWVETIGEPAYRVAYEGGMLAVTVSVRGKARALSATHTDIEARVLRGGRGPESEAADFQSGDALYLLFQAPVAGHLLVYLVDHAEDKAYCLLPYAASAEPAQAVEGGRRYTFFSAQDAPDGHAEAVDEYTMTCGPQAPDHNEVVVIFSPAPLVKSNTTQAGTATPRELPIADFERWRAALMTRDAEAQVIDKPITIQQRQ